MSGMECWREFTTCWAPKLEVVCSARVKNLASWGVEKKEAKVSIVFMSE